MTDENGDEEIEVEATDGPDPWFEDVELTIRTDLVGVAMLGAVLNLGGLRAKGLKAHTDSNAARTFESLEAFAFNTREELDEILGDEEDLRERVGNPAPGEILRGGEVGEHFEIVVQEGE